MFRWFVDSRVKHSDSNLIGCIPIHPIFSIFALNICTRRRWINQPWPNGMDAKIIPRWFEDFNFQAATICCLTWIENMCCKHITYTLQSKHPQLDSHQGRLPEWRDSDGSSSRVSILGATWSDAQHPEWRVKPAVEFTFSYVNRKKKGLQLQGEFVGTQWELDFERMVSTSECLDPIRFAVRSFFPKERTTKTTKPHIDQPGAWHLMNVLFGPDTFCWEFAPAGQLSIHHRRNVGNFRSNIWGNNLVPCGWRICVFRSLEQ